jgi:tRNA(Ile)-lysidine synthetase-like protein
MNKEAIPLAVRRHKLVATVRKAIADQSLVVGVSGGADSIALLLLCCASAMQESATFQVIAGHVHHGLRAESDDEQQLVETLCATLGIQCVTKKVSVTPVNGSLGAGARKARYEALQQIASDANCAVVAVAHHAEDQLETMLMALCRGGGLRKLSGIASVRPLSDSINLHRPLLHVDKQDLVEICILAGIAWCEDPTNDDVSTPRGRLRSDVIPILRDLWSSADRHAANASALLHCATDAFNEKLSEGNTWDRAVLADLPHPIIDATLHKAVGEIATFETIRSIRDAVIDRTKHPRTFQLQECEVVLTSKKVTITHS